AHPKTVSDFLLQEIRYELSIEKADEETQYMLSDVSWSGEWSWNTIGPEIYALLKSSEPKSVVNLTKLLAVLQGSRVADEAIRMLASEKIDRVELQPHAAHWFAVWVGVEPGTAIPALKAHLENTATEKDPTFFAMTFITNLLGGRWGQASRVRQAFRTPQH